MANIPPGLNVYETSQASLHAANFATFSLAAAAVGLRFGSRWISQQRRGLDDWVILGALGASFLLLVDMISWTRSGFGRHYQLFGPSVFPVFFNHLMFADIFYALIQVAVKISMLFFYARYFESPRLRMPMVYMGLFLACWLVAATVTATVQCDPSAAECEIGSRGFPLGIWIPNMVANVMVVGLPLCLIDRSYLPHTQRKLLCAVFCVGGMVLAVSIIRFLSLVAQDGENLDFTWNMVSFGVWTLVESNVAIIAACLPTFQPIWRATDNQLDSRERSSSAFSNTMEEKIAPAWLNAERQPMTPVSPDTPGPGAYPYRDSSDIESGMSAVDLSDDDR